MSCSLMHIFCKFEKHQDKNLLGTREYNFAGTIQTQFDMKYKPQSYYMTHMSYCMVNIGYRQTQSIQPSRKLHTCSFEASLMQLSRRGICFRWYQNIASMMSGRALFSRWQIRSCIGEHKIRLRVLGSSH
jgi:hypothetical protein